jgi:hypothetical protein
MASRLAIGTVEGVAGPRPPSAAGGRGMTRSPERREHGRDPGVAPLADDLTGVRRRYPLGAWLMGIGLGAVLARGGDHS